MMGPRLTLLDTSRTTGEDYVDTPVGISAVLRSVAAGRARAVLYLGDGDTFVHTSILRVEPHSFFFEKGPDPKLNERVLATAQAVMVTADRSVPVQFEVETPRLEQIEGAEAFCAPLPQRLLRLQRRDYYRLPGQAIHSLIRCQLVPGDAPEKMLRPIVIDISCGGMAIDIPTAAGILADTSRHTCTVEFPGLGRIDTPLYVCSSREITLPNDTPGRRYGIEFLNLEAKCAALIQRFINDEERRLVRTSRD
jgi:c-di-GMP-binding flagellar brake protein YcgR